MVELLPGTPEETIQVILHHRTIAQMQTCVAASYEWGGSSRQNEIFCEGSLLRVTSNLLSLLKELRRSLDTRPFWIDAICINQDDLEERSQQVQLMGDIYRNAAFVLIWLGEAQSFTDEAFRIIPLLADKLDSLMLEEELLEGFSGMGQFKDPSEISSGAQLESLARQPSWTGIIDLYLERTYFLRLWIIQEIILSRNSIVVCGGYRINWELFKKAATLIWHCNFLQTGMANFELLRNIYTLATMQRDIRVYGASLWLLISAFSEARASDPRDCIFGLLGMLDEGLQKDFISVDYRRSIEQVYQKATECIIVYEQDLGLWRSLNLEQGVKGGENLPSWVPWFGRQATLFGIRQLKLIDQVCKSQQLMQVKGSTLMVYGLIFDSITYATDNISTSNVKPLSQHAFNNIAGSPTLSIGQDEATTSLWQALIAYDASLHDFNMCENGFLSLMSQTTHTLEGSSAEAQEYYESQMKLELWDEELGLGRNLFRSSQVYFGVGSAGRNTAVEVATPVVKVGDCISLIANTCTPIILRPEYGSHWSVVGAAYIGGINHAPSFQESSLPELRPIYII